MFIHVTGGDFDGLVIAITGEGARKEAFVKGGLYLGNKKCPILFMCKLLINQYKQK